MTLSGKIGWDRGIFNDVDVLRVLDVKNFIKTIKQKKEQVIIESELLEKYFPKGDKRRGEVLAILGEINALQDKEINDEAGGKLI